MLHDPFLTDLADPGSADELVRGRRRCRTDHQCRAWMATHLAVIREGGPELLDAVREVERLDHDSYLEPQLRQAEAAGNEEKMRDLLAQRQASVAARREERYSRLTEELVKLAVRTATTPRKCGA
jgi:hypothetical protein